MTTHPVPRTTTLDPDLTGGVDLGPVQVIELTDGTLFGIDTTDRVRTTGPVDHTQVRAAVHAAATRPGTRIRVTGTIA